MAKVRIPPVLRSEAGGQREIEAAGATVRALLEDVSTRHPQLGQKIYDGEKIAPFVNVYLDGEDVRTLEGVDTPVADGSTLILLPAMAGGQDSGGLRRAYAGAFGGLRRAYAGAFGGLRRAYALASGGLRRAYARG